MNLSLLAPVKAVHDPSPEPFPNPPEVLRPRAKPWSVWHLGSYLPWPPVCPVAYEIARDCWRVWRGRGVGKVDKERGKLDRFLRACCDVDNLGA